MAGRGPQAPEVWKERVSATSPADMNLPSWLFKLAKLSRSDLQVRAKVCLEPTNSSLLQGSVLPADRNLQSDMLLA